MEFPHSLKFNAGNANQGKVVVGARGGSPVVVTAVGSKGGERDRVQG